MGVSCIFVSKVEHVCLWDFLFLIVDFSFGKKPKQKSNITAPSDKQMKRIFGAILNAKLADFEDEVRLLGDTVMLVCIGVYKEIVTMLLPTPSKSHYVFNMRDLAKVHSVIYSIHPINLIMSVCVIFEEEENNSPDNINSVLFVFNVMLLPKFRFSFPHLECTGDTRNTGRPQRHVPHQTKFSQAFHPRVFARLWGSDVGRSRSDMD